MSAIEECRGEMQARLTLEAKALEGRRIVGVRYLTKAECRDQAWLRSTVLLVLDDGTCLFPMQDEEGNDAGSLMIVQQSGHAACLPAVVA